VKESEPKNSVVNIEELPTGFPTHKHPSEFWEALGRTVATFGFLEETLGKAIFAFTATRRIPPTRSTSNSRNGSRHWREHSSIPLAG